MIGMSQPHTMCRSVVHLPRIRNSSIKLLFPLHSSLGPTPPDYVFGWRTPVASLQRTTDSQMSCMQPFIAPMGHFILPLSRHWEVLGSISMSVRHHDWHHDRHHDKVRYNSWWEDVWWARMEQ